MIKNREKELYIGQMVEFMKDSGNKVFSMGKDGIKEVIMFGKKDIGKMAKEYNESMMIYSFIHSLNILKC